MSDILSIGASGVRAYQAALTTTSENIANAGTAGFVRRSAEIGEVAVAGAGASATMTGLGVTVTGLARAGDMFRSAEVRSTASDLARTDAGVTWLERIEGALTGDQLGDRLTDFFNSARALAADPSAISPRTAMLESASGVATAFANTGNALAAAAADIDTATDAAVSDLNGLSAALARVNAAVGRTAPGTASSAAMLDERDRLLEKMSDVVGINVDFDSAGRATVRAGNASGPVLVTGESAATVTYVRSGNETSYAVHRDAATSSMAPASGMLAGMAEGAERIADAQASLDALASGFVEGVNAVQANGRDLLGNAGAPMFAAGDPATQMTLALSDPRGIAAAAVGGGVRDNANLAGLESLRSTGGFETELTQTITANAAALGARRTVSGAQAAMHDSAVAARDSVTAVNIDEEAVNLLRFQQAYQASSRVIQIARETLQTLFDIR